MKKLIYYLFEKIYGLDKYYPYGYSQVVYKQKIVKIKGWNCFIVDAITKDGRTLHRSTILVHTWIERIFKK